MDFLMVITASSRGALAAESVMCTGAKKIESRIKKYLYSRQ